MGRGWKGGRREWEESGKRVGREGEESGKRGGSGGEEIGRRAEREGIEGGERWTAAGTEAGEGGSGDDHAYVRRWERGSDARARPLLSAH